jgi:hypothetical protein
MEENCRGGQGLNWAVEPSRERDVTLMKGGELMVFVRGC